MSLVRRLFKNLGHDLPPLLVKLKSRLLSKAEGSGAFVEVVVVLVMDSRCSSPFSSVVFGFTVTVDAASSSSSVLVGDGVGVPLLSSSSSSSSWRLRSSGASSATHSHFPSTNIGTELSTSSVSYGMSTAVVVEARAVRRNRNAIRRKSGHCNLGRGKKRLVERLEEAMAKSEEPVVRTGPQNIAAS